VLSDEQRIKGDTDKIGRGGSFLDVGCGAAALVKVAQQSFRVTVGCDVAFRWLLIARKRLQEAGLQPNLVCCCADYLPFPDCAFDSVASVSLLEHVSEPAAAIREMRRVTKPGGSIFVWTANRFSLAAEPQEEVRVAWEIVKSLGLRTRGVTVVACPTCGRLDVDNFVEIVTEIERRLAHVEEPLHLSVMGCAVNGPGEAHDSQLGITFGRGVGMIFKDGVPMRKVAGEDIVEAFVMETEKLLAEITSKKALPEPELVSIT